MSPIETWKPGSSNAPIQMEQDERDPPVIFMKPATSLVGPGAAIRFPAHGQELHLETELVALVGRRAGRPCIEALSLGLDLTLRDLQARLKSAGLPWEKAKAFEQSAAVGRFVPCERLPDLDDLHFECHVNDELRQRGNSAEMLFPIPALLVELGRIWDLASGDLIYTGTPPGVGRLRRGDRVRASAEGLGQTNWDIV